MFELTRVTSFLFRILGKDVPDASFSQVYIYIYILHTHTHTYIYIYAKYCNLETVEFSFSRVLHFDQHHKCP